MERPECYSYVTHDRWSCQSLPSRKKTEWSNRYVANEATYVPSEINGKIKP